MKAAFIVMSILGCDDAGVHCQPIASVSQEWPTIASCDSASEAVLQKYRNVNHPMVVAVCQTAGTTALADSQADISEGGFDVASRSVAPVPPASEEEAYPGLTARAITLVKHAIPSRQGLKEALVEKPVHFVTGTYSWVARKVAD